MNFICVRLFAVGNYYAIDCLHLTLSWKHVQVRVWVLLGCKTSRSFIIMWPLHNQSYCNISMKNGSNVIILLSIQKHTNNVHITKRLLSDFCFVWKNSCSGENTAPIYNICLFFSVQATWQSPNTLPTMVHGPVFRIITWKPKIESSSPIRHPGTHWASLCVWALGTFTSTQSCTPSQHITSNYVIQTLILSTWGAFIFG